jgi:hypothetical protein
MVHVAPRELGDVDEPVDPVEVDERAEVDDVRDRAGDDVAGESRSRIAWRISLRSSSSTARRERRRCCGCGSARSPCSAASGHELVEVLDAPDVDERRGQEAAHAEVEDETALDDLDDRASTGSPLSAASSMRFHAISKRARFLERMSRPSASSFVITSASISSPSCTSSAGFTDRGSRARDRDDALGLVADVDQDLVLVDADDLAAHDLALVDDREGRVVVGISSPSGPCVQTSSSDFRGLLR